MLCVYSKSHVPRIKQCSCPQRYEEEHYHESPKGTGYWNKINWSGNSPISSEEFHTSVESHCTCHKDDANELRFSKAFGRGYLSVVSARAEGEPYDIVTGGPSSNNVVGGDIVEQQETLRDNDWYRSILLSEPWGRRGMNAAIVLPPTCPCTDEGIVFMKNDSCKPTHESYPPMSVSGLICATKVMLEYGTNERDELGESQCLISWDTVAGSTTATGFVSTKEKEFWCYFVIVENVPSFVLELDYQVDCPGVGTITTDIAFGGVFCAFVDASSLGIKIELGDAKKMAKLGEHIKSAINASYKCCHPDLPFLKHVSRVVFTESVSTEKRKMLAMATVVSPGRLDRSPSGTATSAQLAILRSLPSCVSEAGLVRETWKL